MDILTILILPIHEHRWIKDLNISHDTIKVLEENIGGKMSDYPSSNIFTDTSPSARDIKERIKHGTTSN